MADDETDPDDEDDLARDLEGEADAEVDGEQVDWDALGRLTRLVDAVLVAKPLPEEEILGYVAQARRLAPGRPDIAADLEARMRGAPPPEDGNAAGGRLDGRDAG